MFQDQINGVCNTQNSAFVGTYIVWNSVHSARNK